MPASSRFTAMRFPVGWNFFFRDCDRGALDARVNNYAKMLKKWRKVGSVSRHPPEDLAVDGLGGRKKKSPARRRESNAFLSIRLKIKIANPPSLHRGALGMVHLS